MKVRHFLKSGWLLSGLLFAFPNSQASGPVTPKEVAFAEGADHSGGGAGIEDAWLKLFNTPLLGKKLYLLDFYERGMQNGAYLSTLYSQREAMNDEVARDIVVIQYICKSLDIALDSPVCLGLQGKIAQIRRYEPDFANTLTNAAFDLQFEINQRPLADPKDDGTVAIPEKKKKYKLRVARRYFAQDGKTHIEFFSGTWNGKWNNGQDWKGGQLVDSSKVGLVTHEIVAYLDAKLNGAKTTENARKANAELYRASPDIIASLKEAVTLLTHVPVASQRPQNVPITRQDVEDILLFERNHNTAIIWNGTYTLEGALKDWFHCGIGNQLIDYSEADYMAVIFPTFREILARGGTLSMNGKSLNRTLTWISNNAGNCSDMSVRDFITLLSQLVVMKEQGWIVMTLQVQPAAPPTAEEERQYQEDAREFKELMSEVRSTPGAWPPAPHSCTAPNVIQAVQTGIHSVCGVETKPDDLRTLGSLCSTGPTTLPSACREIQRGFIKLGCYLTAMRKRCAPNATVKNLTDDALSLGLLPISE